MSSEEYYAREEYGSRPTPPQQSYGYSTTSNVQNPYDDNNIPYPQQSYGYNSGSSLNQNQQTEYGSQPASYGQPAQNAYPSYEQSLHNQPRYGQSSSSQYYGNESNNGYPPKQSNQYAQYPPQHPQPYPPQYAPINHAPAFGEAYRPSPLYLYGGQYNSQDPYNPTNAPEPNDRGVMGALAGGAAGAYGGHQLHHGVVGAVGGAVAGSMLEDHIKDEKKKEKKEEHRYESKGHGWGFMRRNSSNSSSSSSSSDSDDGRKHHHHHHHDQQHGGNEVVLAGNFSASCADITLDGDYDLIASCTGVHGDRRLSSVSLNKCLTNDNGVLKWARDGGFGGSSKDVRLVDGGRVLEAMLGDGRGGWRLNRVRLDERITNQDGELKFLD